ncbi:MAG: hypothetical protein K2O00_05615 [Muribaculaceae bacterium]|nr:hypothetical protein [Muribaculaceae bacterium]
MKHLDDVIKESKPTLVIFQHSGEVNAIDENIVFEEIKSKYEGRANVISVDCSRNGSYKEHYRFQGYPTWILFKEGQELMRAGGSRTVAQVEAMIATAL